MLGTLSLPLRALALGAVAARGAWAQGDGTSAVAMADLYTMSDEELTRGTASGGSIPAVYVALESLPTRMWRSDKLLKVRVYGRILYVCVSLTSPSSQTEVELRSVVLHNDIVKRRAAHIAALKECL